MAAADTPEGRGKGRKGPDEGKGRNVCGEMYIQGNKKCEYEEGCEGERRGRKGASSQEPKMAVTPAVRVMPVNLCPNDRIHTGSGLGERRKKRRRRV